MKDKDAQARLERAKARASWPGKRLTLSDVPELELVAGTPAERIGMVRELTLAAWAMSGRAIPTYTREAMPGRVVRPGEQR